MPLSHKTRKSNLSSPIVANARIVIKRIVFSMIVSDPDMQAGLYRQDAVLSVIMQHRSWT